MPIKTYQFINEYYVMHKKTRQPRKIKYTSKSALIFFFLLPFVKHLIADLKWLMAALKWLMAAKHDISYG